MKPLIPLLALLILSNIPAGAWDETLVISAPKEDSSPVDTAPGVTLITREEIDRSGSLDTGQLLDRLAGVKSERTGGALSPLKISIRGSGPDRVLILVDGIPLPGGDLSLIPPERIEQIEIIKGSASAEGGSGAVGGIIRITTRKTVPVNRIRGESRASLGSYGFKEWSGTIRGEYGLARPLVWGVGLTLTGEDALYGFEEDGEITLRENGSGERYTGYLYCDWEINPEQEIGLRFRAEGSRTDRGIPGTVDFPSLSARLTGSVLTGHLTGFWNSFPLCALEGTFSAGWNTVNYTDTGYLLGDLEEFHEAIPLSAQIILNREDSFGPVSLRSRLTARFEQESLTSTALLDTEGTEGSGTPSRTAWSIALSEQATWETLTLSPVLRWDHATIRSGDFERIDSRFSFAADLAWTPAQTLALKGRISTGFRLPSFEDLFWPATAFAVGNPSLKPEESLSYEVSLVTELLPGWYLSLTHFNSLVTHLIQWNPGPGGTWRPGNIGQASLAGFEGETRYIIPLFSKNGSLTLRGSYGLLLARDRTEGSPTFDKVLPRRPVEQGSAGATLTFPAGHYATAEVRYTGYRYTNSQNTALIPASVITNLSCGLNLNRGWEFRLSVSNLLDTPYIDDLEYPVPGRLLRITLLWTGERQ